MHNLQTLIQEYLSSGNLKQLLQGTGTGFASLDQLMSWYPGTLNYRLTSSILDYKLP